jgi:pyruvate formate lyase activating enzyme
LRKNLKLFENKYFFLLCAFIAIVFSINNTQVDNQELKEASFYTRLTNNKVQCLLCPRKCVLNQNKRGFCNVRVNKLGRLYSLVYGKPFLSILPTPMWSLIYSGLDKNLLQIGTIGCNMRCKFCLSWEISQALPNECPFIKDSICAANSFEPPVNNKLLSPEEVLLFAKKNNLKIICYTLNEPTVSFEYTLDLAKLAKKEGFINTRVQ